jgi:hypothetical protein
MQNPAGDSFTGTGATPTSIHSQSEKLRRTDSFDVHTGGNVPRFAITARQKIHDQTPYRYLHWIMTEKRGFQVCMFDVSSTLAPTGLNRSVRTQPFRAICFETRQSGRRCGSRRRGSAFLLGDSATSNCYARCDSHHPSAHLTRAVAASARRSGALAAHATLERAGCHAYLEQRPSHSACF